MKHTPSSSRGRQGGVSQRRALLGLIGLAAAGAGAWWGWRRQQRPAAETGLASTDHGAPTVGDSLPPGFWQVHFDTPEGQALDWAGLQGKPLLLNFWATWCPPCVKEMPELDRFRQTFAEQGWQVVGLAIDGPTPVKEFLAKVKVGFAIGLAGFGGTELAQTLGNQSGGLPFTVLIDAKGRIRHRKMGATTYEELAKWAREVGVS